MRNPRDMACVAAVLLLAFLPGCGRPPEAPADASEAHMHHHHAPHGGTVVSLGDEESHVELVVDQASGKIQAYVLDSELENFVRASSPSMAISAVVGGRPVSVTLSAVANPETGETVGDTSLFEGQADWLKAQPKFDAVLRSLSIRGASYTDVKFGFPAGNETAR